jgi:hypothetical protein
MKLFRVSNIALMLFMLLISAAGAFAQQGNGPPPPPPGAGLCTDGQYLFVMAGDTLYQYAAADLSLVATVALPKLAPPPDSDNQTQPSKFMARWGEKVKNKREKVSGDVSSDNQTQPPPPPAGAGLCTDGEYLFMLRGHSIQQYTVADMTLVKSVELPKPEPPPTAD